MRKITRVLVRFGIRWDLSIIVWICLTADLGSAW